MGMGTTRLVAGLLVVGGAAVGFYGPAMGSVEPTGPTRIVGTDSEQTPGGATPDDPGTYRAPGTDALDASLLEPADLGEGWMATGYEPGTTELCPLRALTGYHNLGRAHAGFSDVGATVVVAEQLTRYEPGDAPLVIATVLDGVASCGSGGDRATWSDDAGEWTATAAPAEGGADVSLRNVSPGGTTVSIEGRWRTTGDTVVCILVASYGGPRADVAERAALAALTKAS